MPFDIGIGIILSIAFAHFFGIDLSWVLVMFGVLVSLGPDIIDGLPRLKTMFSENAHKHRDGAHYPLYYIIAGSIIVSLVLPWGLAGVFLFVLISVIHFLHDCIGVGWGIRMFYPFSKKYFKFFSPDLDLHNKRVSTYISTEKIISIWTKADVQKINHIHGRKDWITWYYFKQSAGYVEWTVFLIGIWLLFVNI